MLHVCIPAASYQLFPQGTNGLHKMIEKLVDGVKLLVDRYRCEQFIMLAASIHGILTLNESVGIFTGPYVYFKLPCRSGNIRYTSQPM